MAVQDHYLQWVLEQLAGAGQITSRRMFGAIGLYRDGVFFAIISADTLYFKVDAASRGDYAARGMLQFRPYRDRPHLSMNYFAVPADVLEDPEECVRWALRAAAAGKTPPPEHQRGRRRRAQPPVSR
jgi:DNA transformation protein